MNFSRVSLILRSIWRKICVFKLSGCPATFDIMSSQLESATWFLGWLFPKSKEDEL